MMLISEYISSQLPSDASVEEFCRGVTEYIRSKVYEPQGLTEQLFRHPEERLTASAIIYSDRRKELWLVGDCQALVDGRLYDNAKPHEQEIAQKRVELIAQGVSPAEARKRIEPILIETMLTGQNKKYAVIDGFPIYEEGVKTVSLDDTLPHASDKHEIVLASDGYPFLKQTLADSEKALSHLIATDPQCIRYFIATKGLVSSNKSFDDRTYIRFVL